jgi:uncharacterized protein YjbI with pentapeptide repeats
MLNLKVLALGSFAVIGLSLWTTTNILFAHGGDTNFIHGCAANSNGRLRVVDALTDCANTETAVDWSQNGIGTFGGFTTNQLIGYVADGENFNYRLFDGANFTGSGLGNVSMDYASFDGANFFESTISGSTLKFASFVAASFDTAAIIGSDLESADFSGTDFTDGQISSGAILTDTNFTSANFTSTVFGPGLTISGTNFTNADFTGALMLGEDFSDSILTGANWSNTTCPDGTNSDNNGDTCEGHLVP